MTNARDDLLLEIVLSDKKRLCKVVSRVSGWLPGCSLGVLNGCQDVAKRLLGCSRWLPWKHLVVTRVFWVVTEKLLDGC